jgi:hypothetical protein
MAGRDEGIGEISAGAILVVIGIAVMLSLSASAGLLTTLFGLIGFGGFARGRWS